MRAFSETQLQLDNRHSGKVRDSYSLPDQRRLMVTTDRLSAFDVVVGKVPYKGQVLNQLSAWWFKQLEEIIPHHMIDTPDPNALIAKAVTPLPIEVIVRGFLTGVTKTSLWHRYSLGERSIYGHSFPDDLKKNQKLQEAIITPTTKGGPTGHDELLTCDDVVSQGFALAKDWQAIQSAALAIFERGQILAAKAGLILVDTKYEFGHDKEGRILLIDEVHTPDSSRFWKADTYERNFNQGLEPESFDKEMVRLAFAKIGYRGDGPVPDLPQEVWDEVQDRYVRIFEMLTGQPFVRGSYPVGPRLSENLKLAGILS